MAAGDNRELTLEGTLWELVRATASASGENFFRELTRSLAAALDVRYVALNEVTDRPGQLRTLAMWSGSGWDDNIEYDLSGTPCGQVIETRELCCFSRDVRSMFPDDPMLVDLGIESYMGAPFLSATGEPIGHLCVLDTKPILDEESARTILVTFASRAALELDRLRAIRETERQRAYLRQVLDTNPSYIFAKDRDGRFTLVNKATAEIYGSTVEGVTGKTDADFNPNEEEVAFFRKMDLEVMDTRQERLIPEEPITDSNGELHWAQTIKRPIVNPDGTVDQVLGVATDITELKRVREELVNRQKQEKEKVQAELNKVKAELIRKTRLAAIGQVAASIAHDLRNPLGAINNAVYYLKRRKSELSPRTVEYLDLIRQEALSSGRIVGNLLEMTRAKDPAKEPVDLAGAARETFEQVRRLSEARLRLEIDPDPFVVHADRHQLRQVLGNLLTNAIQAMNGSGEVVLEARRHDGQDVLVLRDEGPGVPPGTREKIFEPLYTTKAKGTGLGLAICRQIIERHGATISLAPSEKGAAFEIRLPASPAKEI